MSGRGRPILKLIGTVMTVPTLAFDVEPSRRKYRLRLARYKGVAEALVQFLQTAWAGRDDPVRLLDVGVGNGRTLRYCQAAAIDQRIAFHGVDNSTRRLANVHASWRWKLALGDVQKGLPYPDASFDAVVCEQVLEHLPDAPRVVGELVRVLAPGGLLIAGVPTFSAPLAFLRRNVVPVFDRLFGVKRDHVQVFTLGSFRRLLEGAGLTIQDARGFRLVSGGPLAFLEDYEWWYRLNRSVGRAVPGLCTEVQVLASKPAVAAAGRVAA